MSQTSDGIQNVRGSMDAPHRQVATCAPDTAPDKLSPRQAGVEPVIAICATFTAEPVRDPLAYWLCKIGSPARVQFAPDNQVFHQLFDPASLLAGNTNGMNMILVRLQDWNTDQQATENHMRELIAALQSAAARSSIAHLLCFCPSDTPPLADFYNCLEESICAGLAENSNIQCVTSAAIEELYPVADRYDPFTDKLGHIPYTPEFYAALGTLLARRFFVSQMPPRKVIVLDCDNTLWSGACGEIGPTGVKIDEGRLFLQDFMLRQIDAGMILCVCSKNEEEDVEAVFRLRKEMPLRREHFIGWRVNWNPKSHNLRSLAKELNLGLDSFIFLDDNPVECAEVRAHCPEVLTLQVPETQIPSLLQHMWAFDHLRVTDEDRQRSVMYKQNALRQQVQSKASSLADFLASLELKIAIEPIKPAQLARTAQLTQRTNQFNFSTRRRSASAIQKLSTSPGRGVLTVNVRDRFGDYGLVGLMIYTTNGEALGIDTFLLSCRVLGRGVEHRMLSRLGELAEAQGLQYVDAHFIPSAKNKPALNFLESCGAKVQRETSGQMTYRIPSAVAAGLVLDVSRAMPEPLQETSKDAISAASTAPAFDWSALTWIAANSSDAGRTLRDVEIAGVKVSDPSQASAEYVAPRTETERQVARIWESALRLSRVGVNEDFYALGGDSLEAVIVLSQIAKLTGKTLPMLTFHESPTVAKLAAILDGTQLQMQVQLGEVLHQTGTGAALARNGEEIYIHVENTFGSRLHLSLPVPAADAVHISCLKSGNPKTPVFWIPGGGGLSVIAFRRISALIGTDRSVYGLEASIEQSRKPIDLRIKARAYVEALRTQWPNGPYYLFGFSAGSWLAYEMAVQLEALGQQSLLVVFDITMRGFPGFLGKIGTALELLRLHAKKMGALPASSWLPFTRRITQDRLRRMRENSIKRNWNGEEDGLDLFTVAEYQNWRATEAYQTSKLTSFSGGIRVVLASASIFDGVARSLDPRLGWCKLARGKLDVFRVPGDHHSMLQEPNVNALADALKQILSDADQEFLPHVSR
jgi:FkbH-like protein